MQLRFWGTRGSIATPGPSTLRYGGNTSCVEAVTKSGQRFIFDCGTGARPLGAWLMANAPKPVSATLLLSHTHWDHIQGFPFFVPLFVPGSRMTVCGPHGAKSSLPEVLAGQMEYTYFPVELSQLGAEIQYEDLTEGFREIGGVRIGAQLLNHPATAWVTGSKLTGSRCCISAIMSLTGKAFGTPVRNPANRRRFFTKGTAGTRPSCKMPTW